MLIPLLPNNVAVVPFPLKGLPRHVEVESEFWTSSDDDDIQPAAQLAGPGAPTVNADFVGQNYFDTTNSKFYVSIGVVSGSSDWVLAGP